MRLQCSARDLLILVTIGGSGLGLLLTLLRNAEGSAGCATCGENLNQISVTLHSYHNDFGCFPPAYVADARGRPMHSRRVLILPYLSHQELYDAYNVAEPWDGPNNRNLAGLMPDIYACPSWRNPAATTRTSYVAVVGPHTDWPGARSRVWTEIRDPTDRTISLVEVADAAIPWLEPRDLTFDRMSFQVNDPTQPSISGNVGRHGAGVTFSNGRLR